MNKELYNKEIEFPKDKRLHIKKCFLMVPDADENEDGYKRNKELQNSETIGYRQLKRIKNFFDNFKGTHKDASFILNGGFIMKNWVNDELRKMREFRKLTNKNKMEAGMQNQFIDPHEKKDFNNVRPSQEHIRSVDRYNAKVTESLKRINEIISKL